ncbi:aspartyl-phosphate phosphatase Spo0E family protein [Salibacterium aidingense]|uniref:aspartyl-phosphate phosphatase Spo0E family protein n=1 Tax=Salibacterium aidingense TaxID=384933 RepID=UPI00041E229B|nr:aspartyl-phosphate phosphatase Spo0E family protein [Salibacterium aidingense]
MTSKMEEIQRQIENLRKQLHDISKDKSLTDPEMLEKSAKLDEVLNEYEKLLVKKLYNKE